ncbi:tubby-related protein 4 isoform X1 [Vespa crabro]|uniref:tubby-related protein 4 isoform X1 n=1 Tax=Vespa crabro TaxID=7445 RepID=UPI001F00D720|nr:tubby-related protein 4 isoform X1 [Vespa crabro]XP_046829625.1 tubby-related protein 4 isoform X1 [Vespa crabro]XP_046829626.1 tubby-related protein 4 isoform X1 [Vespa crabro]XP_046829627.1 tubby-related protein 4 isoform X1 [Vespa crabro]
MHLHFEKNNNAKCDCNILSLSWMGKVPDESPEDEGWKLDRTNYYQEGWLATGNARGLVGVTFTTSHCRTRAAELPLRANYNLRGHRSEVIFVKWNEPYQKLASCDSSGVIFVWIKYEGRWSIELINDRNTPVTHFSWSHDGRMALICYRDGFVLVGSVGGQRYWSSMLNDKATITCGIWTPDDQQVYFGTTAGQLIVMDVHGAMVSEVQLAAGVTSMAWSAEKFTMEEGDEDVTSDRSRRDERNYILAVCLADGNIVMLRSFDDVSPITVRTNLKTPLHAEWSNSRKLLAIAGTKDSDSLPQNNSLEYTNLLKFYSVNGTLVYTTVIPYTQCPVSALTWGHNDRRLFVATGARVHAAWVSRRVGSLQLLSRLAVRAALTRESSVQQLPLPSRLRASVAALFASTIRCPVPEPRELRRFVSRPPAGSGRLHCTMLRHAVEPIPCYTLYLEYLGGLVPLLKGRRTSKIRPEFVIFDPQSQDTLQLFDDVSQCPSFSDGSDTERDTADLCGSPRNRRKNRRKKEEKGSEETDDLTYVDTLPEHARLVEVTSNIWGTKFKFHGLADSVPANLGQVTYRTSLLHLQPRQMTLVMTELRDDLPAGPDPSFNPNLFSEDEEETFQDLQGTSRATSETQPPPIAPMTPRNARLNPNRPKSQISNQFLTTEALPASLARVENYENEFPYVDLQEMTNLYENIRSAPTNTYRTPPRHNPPRCCDVPALQSPKNAVAPTQTLIATSNTSTDYSSNIQRVKTALADQQNTGMVTKKELENNKLNQISQEDKSSLNSGSSNIIPTSMHNGQIPLAEASSSQNSILNNLDGGNDCSQSQMIYMNGLNIMTSCSSNVLNSNHSNNVQQSCHGFLHPRNNQNNGTNLSISPSQSNLNPFSKHNNGSNGSSSLLLPSTCSYQLSDNSDHEQSTSCSPCNLKQQKEMKSQGSYGKINVSNQSNGKTEELRFIDEESKAEADIEQFRGVHRTPTVVSIGPLCSNDSIVRSCSVGYLDLVDVHQLVPCDVALKMLRKEAPNKRLVLVSRKTKRRKKNRPQHDIGQQNSKPPRLRNCGKSKSLDSSDIFPSNELITTPPKLPEHLEEASNIVNNSEIVTEEKCSDLNIVVLGEINNDTVMERQKKILHGNDETYVEKPCRLETCVSPVRGSSPSGSLASSLDGLAARLKDFDESHSLPPPSPRPSSSCRLPRSSPSSPAPSKKGKRPASASPIRRRLLSSPLLNRRTRKSRGESSDEEGLIQDDSSSNYRDLETFQKAQLRQKLKQRGAGMSNGHNKQETTRRELVMHNKAPMWNEASQVYQLDFGGRVTQESAKNFQIEFRGKQVMQFGRIDGNAYTLDFQYPFSALQAFAVALANVTQRLK